MAQRFNRRCRKFGCCKLTRDVSGWCDEHKKENWRVNYSESRKQRNEFYKTAAWLKLRRWKLSVNPICENDFCTQAARVVDHVDPIFFNGEVREHLKLNSENLQSLCARCHDIKRGREAH